MMLDELAQANEELLDRWQQTMEALQPALGAWRDAMLEFGRVLSESLRPLLDAFREWFEEMQREELCRRLCHRHVPHSLARFLTRRWPRRWLPGLEGVG